MGKKFSQSLAIQAYLAERLGLYGKTEMDHLLIQQLQCTREDLLVPETQHFLCQDDKEKAEKDKNLVDNIYPRYLEMFDAMIKETRALNKSKDGSFLIGDKLSLADIVVFEAFTTLSQNHPELLAKYKDIVALRETVAKVPKIKKFLESKKSAPM